MVESIIVRMNYPSLVGIMKVFPSYPDEKMPGYFKRLAKFLKGGIRK